MRGVPRATKPRTRRKSAEVVETTLPVVSPEEWFASSGWTPLEFQREAWAAYASGESGLIHASTGSGKTYAAFFGPVLEALNEARTATPAPLRVLWVTPLRALSADTALALEAPLRPLGLKWDVGVRTGDTTSSTRAKQKTRLPTVLVTTPESLSLLLTYPDARERFADLRCIVCDEWHELFGSKRGVQTELALARLRNFTPNVRTWGLSATIGNLDEALAALVGVNRPGRKIIGAVPKPVVVDSVLPAKIERFPWAGHLGMALLPQVLEAVDEARSALVFTNTRSQCELWHQAIASARPDLAGKLGIHHGSLDRQERSEVEEGLRRGTLRCVVCTSTLDLGVDFAPVDRVLQIGSPKGVARLLQHAGRSGHRPGETSRVTCVPTNAFELVEAAAARQASSNGRIEARDPIEKPLDVLAQHLVGSALAGGFCAEELLREVRTAYSYRHLSDEEWDWVLDFVTRGGDSLKAYPEFRRVVESDGLYTVPDEKQARRHRQSVGTITSDASVLVRFLRGAKLGTVEESFCARLKQGDRFTFAGRVLEYVRFHEMTLWVRLSKKPPNTVPRWAGGRLPLTSELCSAVRAKLRQALEGEVDDPELEALGPVLEIQHRWSRIPADDELLVERIHSRDGHHLFVFPFEGRLVHEGIAALAAFRLTKQRPQTFTIAVNDYGLELTSPDPIDVDPEGLRILLDPTTIADDLLESLNAAELAKRQFREIARIAGLIQPSLPNRERTARQLQASSGLFYDVFREYDPGNLLLWQARREVLDRQFEVSRLRAALVRIAASRIVFASPMRPTPFAFPLLVETMRETVSSEKLADRVQRLVADLERQASRS